MNEDQSRERGSAHIAIRQYVRDRFGSEGEGKLLENLPPEAADTYLNAVAHGWYPTEHSRVLMEAVFEMANREEGAMREIGAIQARNDVKGIVRFLVLFTTPHQLVRRASKMWSQYLTVGALNYEKVTPNSCEIVRTGYNNGELDCLMVTGFTRELAGFTGARNVEATETECVNKGGRVCRWKISWT